MRQQVLGYMSPHCACHDSAHMRLVDAVARSDLALGHSVGCICTDSTHVCGHQTGGSVPIRVCPASTTSFLPHVGDIVHARTKEQVFRATAAWVITSVQNPLTCWDIAVREYPCHAVSTDVLALIPEPSVTRGGYETSPRPACTRALHLLPKTIGDRASPAYPMARVRAISGWVPLLVVKRLSAHIAGTFDLLMRSTVDVLAHDVSIAWLPLLGAR